MGPKQKKDKTEIATGLRRRTREDIIIEKWDQTDSSEIPDRRGGGGTSEIPRPPFRGYWPGHECRDGKS